MSHHAAAITLRLAESMLGRRMLWRVGRRLYLTARRDGLGDPAANGEYALHRFAAAHAASQKGKFTIIDVGAFTGYWSHHLLAACKAAGVTSVSLLAFEPSTDGRRKFTERMHGEFPKYEVRLRSEAVSDCTGEAMFNLDPARGGANGLVATNVRGADSNPAVQRVATLTLADVFAQEGLSTAHFVKTDAEGFDLSIIKGSIPLLEKGQIGLFQFEYNHCWLNTRTMLRDVFDLLPAIPYRLCKVAPEGLQAYKCWSSELEKFYEANYVLIKNDLASAYLVQDYEFDAHNTLRTVG
jgi:FkbM family methyltransferase